MDGHQFDEFVTNGDGAPTRRRLLAALAGGALGALPGSGSNGQSSSARGRRPPVAAYIASVEPALSPSQQDLIDHDEHCSADPEKLATVGRAAGQQVRIKRSSSEYALYTVSEPRQESPAAIVRMGPAGLGRLGTGEAFPATLGARVPHPTFTDAEAEANGEFVERLRDDGAQKALIAIAPHGGDIEPFTAQQAEHVARLLGAKRVSAWRCKGWKPGGGAHERWHITSTDIHPASFPLLGRVIRRGFRHAVAFHGFAGSEILVGGGAATGSLKAEIKGAIEGAIGGSGIPVRVAGPEDEFGGGSPRNVVNRLTAGRAHGIQIEQSLVARRDHGLAIAEAVARVYRDRLR